MNNKEIALWLDDQPVSTKEIMGVLQRERKLPEVVKNLVLDRALNQVHIPENQEKELLKKFRKEQNLENEITYAAFLEKNHLNEILLLQSLTRPNRVVQYREERWGTRSNSLYLKHKDKYDQITYKRLQSNNADVMQEVYFRLKDKEESWESIARQFPGAGANADAMQRDVPAAHVETVLLDELRRVGPGVITRPIRINSTTVVLAELEKIKASEFNEEMRNTVLREEFDKWLQEECNKMISKLKVPA